MVAMVIDDGTMLRVGVGANLQKLKALSGRRILGLYQFDLELLYTCILGQKLDQYLVSCPILVPHLFKY